MVLFHAAPHQSLPPYSEGMSVPFAESEREKARKERDAEAARVLAAAHKEIPFADLDVVEHMAVSNLPCEVIIETAKERGCDLIVMAPHGHRGIAGVLLGSETQRVLAQSPIPVLVVR